MAYGTLPNIANAGHEPTPDARAGQLARNLLKLPRSHFTIIDPTCGEGNLLAPFVSNAHAELIGIEINGKWAEQAVQRLPQAQIITAAVEHVSIAPNSLSLAVLNPPYLVTNGGRMELQVFRQLCDSVQPHGVVACIIPVRSAWDRRFITTWARRCSDVRAWKFPSTGDIDDRAGFERYSQIVVVGYKRPQPLGSLLGPFAVDLNADQLGVGVALEGRKQVALAASTVDDGEVAAGEFEQIMRDLLRPYVGCRLVPGIGDVGKGAVGH